MSGDRIRPESESRSARARIAAREAAWAAEGRERGPDRDRRLAELDAWVAAEAEVLLRQYGVVARYFRLHGGIPGRRRAASEV
jgi:hypothetical protein